MTDVIPDRVGVAIPRGRRIPALHAPVDVHVFAKDTFGLGRKAIRIGDGLAIGLYSAERSLVDVVRLRHREGAEIAWGGAALLVAAEGRQARGTDRDGLVVPRG